MTDTFKLTIQGVECEFRRPLHHEFDIEDFDIGCMLVLQHQGALIAPKSSAGERKAYGLITGHMKDLGDMGVVAMQLCCVSGHKIASLYENIEGAVRMARFQDASEFKQAVKPGNEALKNLLGRSLPSGEKTESKTETPGLPSAEESSSDTTEPSSGNGQSPESVRTSAPPMESASTS